MPLITPSNPGGLANLGSLMDARWTGIVGAAGSSSARITGFNAAFGTIAGGETFGINRDSAGVVTITLTATATQAAVITNVNANVGAGTALAVPSGGIRLVGQHSIITSGISDTLFAKIGIPIQTRTDADNLTAISLPINIEGDEGELISSALPVPAGANRVTVWVKHTNSGAYGLGSNIGFAWGNGVNDAARITNLSAVPGQAIANSTLVSPGTDISSAQHKVWGEGIFLVGSLPSGSTERMLVLDVPPWALNLYLIVTATQSEGATIPPTTPPTFSAKVGFGAR